LSVIENSQPNDYPGALEKNLADAFKSSKNERTALMEILACIEVLQAKSYERPSRGKHDWKYIADWRGEDKYDKDAVEKYFGKYL
jgi:hypothetical protein